MFILFGLISSYADKGITVDLYDIKGETAYFETEDMSKYAVQFKTDSPVKEISLYIEKATANRSKLTMYLYAWNNNYGLTVKQNAIATKTFEKFGRDIWLSLTTDNLVPGEYLLVFIPEAGGIKLRMDISKLDTSRSYENASEINGNIYSRILLSEGNEKSIKKVSDNTNNFIAMPDTYVATDGLDRTLPTQKEAGRKKKDKFVGIFFHTWHSNFCTNSFADISQILKQNPNEKDFSKIDWQNKFSYFWSEPIWSYYDTKDKWVLRKQAEMLADAGVDVIIMDNTNGTDIFKNGLLALLDVFSEARADGVKTPQVSFLLPMFGPYTDTADQIRQLYDLIYSKGRYKDLWFCWKGKPLMMGCPDALDVYDPIDAEILDFFTYRPANPSYREDHAQIFDESGVKVYIHPPEGYITWQWISVIPQQVAYNKDGSPEQICVSVAQNWSNEQGLTAMSSNDPDKLFGRTYSTKLKGHDTRENAYLYGKNFEEQWEYALKVDPEFVFITGWNEWRAGLNKEIWGTKNGFADTFDDNNSRDIEPSKGDLKDHYYYQMVSYIRKFKGVSESPKVSDKVTVDIHSSQDEWKDVTPYYAAYPGNTFARDAKGYGNIVLRQDTGRNDITGAKVARDDSYIYFMVETMKELTPDGLRLLIDVADQKNTNHWETFEYIVNRTENELERSTGGWNWEKVGEVESSVMGNRLQFKIPKSMLGINSDGFTINFKWSDNMQNEGDIMDFYTNGDVAPGGRFKFSYSTKENENKSNVKTITLIAIIAVLALLGIIVLVKNGRTKKLK